MYFRGLQMKFNTNNHKNCVIDIIFFKLQHLVKNEKSNMSIPVRFNSRKGR